jgi:hypothetical protein
MTSGGSPQSPYLPDPSRPVGRLQRVLVVGVAALLLAGVTGLLVVRKGERSPTEALARVRAFVQAQKTATFTGTSESTFAPTSDDVGHTSTTRARFNGEIRLPGEAHIVFDSGDFASEVLLVDGTSYARSADSRAELDGEQWVKWEQEGEDDEDEEDTAAAGPGVVTSFGGPASRAAADAMGFISASGPGSPVELDALFAELAEPERLAPNRIRAEVPLRDLVPEEAQRRLDDAREDAEDKEGFDDWLDGTLAVTIDYGPDGRLDVLVFDTEHDIEGERSTEHQEFRFADWGKPVTFAAPAQDKVDATPHIDEQGLAQAQGRFTVLAPTTPPAGWVLQSLTFDERDSEIETCAVVELIYTAADLPEPDQETDEDDEELPEPPMITVASVEPDCPWLEDSLPDLSEARTVRIGSWSAKATENTEDNYFSWLEEGVTFVFEAHGTRVAAAGNLPEAEVVRVLRTLAPIDLSKQAIGPGGAVYGF